MWKQLVASVKQRLKAFGDARLALEKLNLWHQAPKPAPLNYCPHCGRSGVPPEELHETEHGPVCIRCEKMAMESPAAT
jgi:hypothetical protein